MTSAAPFFVSQSAHFHTAPLAPAPEAVAAAVDAIMLVALKPEPKLNVLNTGIVLLGAAAPIVDDSGAAALAAGRAARHVSHDDEVAVF